MGCLLDYLITTYDVMGLDVYDGREGEGEGIYEKY